MAIANALAGNPPDAATLEITAAGPRLRVLADVRVALAGADLGAAVDGIALPPGRAADVRGGAEIRVPGPPAGGLRAYLAFAGGLDVPLVLGSRSTCASGGFGGVEGRALRAGDRIGLRRRDGGALLGDAADAWPRSVTTPRAADDGGATVLRVLANPLAAAALEALAGTGWRIADASDRMGVRLEPQASSRGRAPSATALPSHGVVPGTIQLPPDGRPIVLGVDHQTTGGYPVAGTVITADLPAIGQLAPGDLVGFEPVDATTARLLLRDQRTAWDEAVRAARREAAWDSLWRSAGA